ncbi:uncharacterized protein PHALS_00325 [Plasmopara halstedii]|uniref:Uncharacterized protein n=1 Tax=Plasmopara halstedii TaxID=4781 RepID=A0A0N7L3I9_PLAHL|nr:uncharacterized protein PHALS_00325 [Plasmopara halstedii]CEG36003.1 hypothetical protein PHALS_00325 [Plasmopara halstedii]|eukprot:XP_024572372.1 hypothetical protein PHALS_00325 [Plasmopara halstedii]
MSLIPVSAEKTEGPFLTIGLGTVSSWALLGAELDGEGGRELRYSDETENIEHLARSTWLFSLKTC